MSLSLPNQYKIWLLIGLLIFSVVIRLPGLFSRAIWYDEAITLLETTGNARPSWPQKPVSASTAKKLFEGAPTLIKIAKDLRQTDIHPPVYYWLLSLWRRWISFSLENARAFSLVCSIGSILALYLILNAGKIKRPIIPSLIYATSTNAVFFGHEARAYALASLMIGMGTLFAYLASEVALRNKTHLAIYSTAMAICCGVAFQTNYLTLFSACIILLWFLICLWPASRFIAVVSLLLAVSIWLIGLPSFLKQLGMRTHQAVGFVGIFPEITKIIKMNMDVICTLMFRNNILNLLLLAVLLWVLIVMMLITATQIRRHWFETNRKLLVLFFGLACAPSLGLFMMDLIFDKNLANSRYLMLAGPALSVILAYGITLPISSLRAMRIILLAILLIFQMAVINWGFERSSCQGGSNMRSLAITIKTSSSHSHIVVIGVGYGRGDPGSIIYELDDEAMIVVLDKDSKIEELMADLQEYDDIWVVYSSDRKTANIENNLLNHIQKSGRYMKVFHEQSAIHLRKIFQEKLSD